MKRLQNYYMCSCIHHYYNRYGYSLLLEKN